jgi:hypothetical protein
MWRGHVRPAFWRQLELERYFHTVFFDGVFTRDDAAARSEGKEELGGVPVATGADKGRV